MSSHSWSLCPLSAPSLPAFPQSFIPSPLAQNQTDRILLTVDTISHHSNSPFLQETAQASLPPLIVIPLSFYPFFRSFCSKFSQNLQKSNDQNSPNGRQSLTMFYCTRNVLPVFSPPPFQPIINHLNRMSFFSFNSQSHFTRFCWFLCFLLQSHLFLLFYIVLSF
jgi:hypothetical protein